MMLGLVEKMRDKRRKKETKRADATGWMKRQDAVN